jgi:hypothetical protein
MLKRIIQITLILSLFLSLKPSFSQVRSNIEQMEDSLNFLSQEIRKAENDSVRLVLNKQFHATLHRTLFLEGSFDYPFDSIKILAKLTSPDKKFRIYNWNLPKDDGTNIYFGFIQLHPKGNMDAVYDLNDCSDSIPQPEITLLDNLSWFGSLYYEIILTTFNNQKFYTLLGWDGINNQLTQKVIDVLYFDNSNHPHFGAKIFSNYGNDQICRVLFKYSSSASMVLTYDNQYLIKNKKWNSTKKQFETDREKAWMIVCDELIPMEPLFEGQFEYYVPSSEVFNAFIFKNGRWNFMKNVDVRNKRN